MYIEKIPELRAALNVRPAPLAMYNALSGWIHYDVIRGLAFFAVLWHNLPG
ncbi:MAG: hypothetical protein LBD48_13185 [Treponema sp.]|jgi:hypothetical protein|nr:hypothetical protein [Treponema sp.]